MFVGIRLKTFQINPQGCTHSPCTRQSEHDPRTVSKSNTDALVAADAAINGIGITEIIGKVDLIVTKDLPW